MGHIIRQETSEANSASRSGTTSAPRSAIAYRPGKPLTRYLPQVAVATFLVSVMPIIVVWLLRSAGAIGPWTSLVLAMALSTILSWVGCAYWMRSRGSGDLLFSELLVWGWLRRWRAERRLASAIDLLGLVQTNGEHPAGWSVGRQEELLRALAEALEAEDRYTRGHSDRVARYAGSIARRMGLSTAEVKAVRAAALVHDVGKLRVPAEVLNKPTRLTDEEFALIKRHPVDGAVMVTSLGNDELTSVVRHHHERMDGKGYPDGLVGEQIPLGARIIAVADTFDAITSVRPYRPRRAHKQALDILAAEQGLQLDREAVRAFLYLLFGPEVDRALGRGRVCVTTRRVVDDGRGGRGDGHDWQRRGHGCRDRRDRRRGDDLGSGGSRRSQPPVRDRAHLSAARPCAARPRRAYPASRRTCRGVISRRRSCQRAWARLEPSVSCRGETKASAPYPPRGPPSSPPSRSPPR